MNDEKTEVQKLEAKLEEVGGFLGGVTLGPDGVGNPEAVAREIRKSLEAMERGEFELVWDSTLEDHVIGS